MDDVLYEMLSYYGLKEVFGPDSNPDILAMFHDLGYNWVQDDETAWCSAIMNYVCKKNGYWYSGKLDAQSWLNAPVKVDEPVLGDIVIYWREKPDSWKGHVGLFISNRDNLIYTLGGNQENMVKISPYSINRVKGYRRTIKL